MVPFHAPSLVTYITASQRRSRACPDLGERAAAFWAMGFNSAEIARAINSHGEGRWLVTEAEVVRALMALRARKAGR